jgi:hypothetical protein
MIPKKPGPDLIGAGDRFSEKIMLHQRARANACPRSRDDGACVCPPWMRRAAVISIGSQEGNAAVKIRAFEFV